MFLCAAGRISLAVSFRYHETKISPQYLELTISTVSFIRRGTGKAPFAMFLRSVGRALVGPSRGAARSNRVLARISSHDAPKAAPNAFSCACS